MSADWHGVVLPSSVRDPLERLKRAMLDSHAAPSAPAVRLLLWGAPGTGKTEIRRALARHSGSGLHTIDARESDLHAPYIGATAVAVRSLFARARAAAPTLLLIDRFDTYFPRRGGAGAQPAEERILAVLQELDDPRTQERVFIVGETNEPRTVDEAMLQRGFELLKVPLPDLAGRAAILRREFRTIPLAADLDVNETAETLAGLLDGRSGRDLVALVRRSMDRAAQEKFARGEVGNDVALTREMLLAGDVLNARTRHGARC